MLIVNPEINWDGSHPNLNIEDISQCPSNWALVPENLEIENFPYGEVEVAMGDNGYLVVTSWYPLPVPQAEIPTASEQREIAYNTEKVISWEDEMLTVTEASQKWQYYASECHEYATQLQTLIAEAKAAVRARYPD